MFRNFFIYSFLAVTFYWKKFAVWAKLCDTEGEDKPIYIWPMTNDDKAFIETTLNVTLPFDSILADVPLMNCECGKIFGFDDLVYTALKKGVHGGIFMAQVVQNHNMTVNQGTKHELLCRKCCKKAPVLMGWASNFGWTTERQLYEELRKVAKNIEQVRALQSENPAYN